MQLALMPTRGRDFQSFWPCMALAEAGGLLCSWAELGSLKNLLSVLCLGQALCLISLPEKLGQLLASKRESESIPTALTPPVGLMVITQNGWDPECII